MKPGIQETRDTGNKGYRKREFRTGGNGNRRDAEQGIQNAGQLGCRKGGMQNKQERCCTVEIGKVGCRTGGMHEIRDAGKEGCRTGGMQDLRDAGTEGCKG